MSNHFFSSDSIDKAEQDAELLATKTGVSSSVLLRDDRLGSRTPKSVEPSLRALQLPMVPVSLFLNGPDSLSLVSVEVAVEVEGGGEGRLEPSEPDADSAILETVLGAVGERLLMFTRPGCRVRVNGLPAPIVAPLALGDQLGLDAEHLLHVSRRNQSGPVPAPAWLIGKSCEVCLVPFSSESPVVLCSSCGAGRHMQGEEVSPDERLECASLGACPNCQSESPQTGDLAYLPED